MALPAGTFPRFDALSFALAREDEYEADRVSARLFGSEVASQALLEIAIKAQWYEQEFWRRHWRLSRRVEAQPSPFMPTCRSSLQRSQRARLAARGPAP